MTFDFSIFDATEDEFFGGGEEGELNRGAAKDYVDPAYGGNDSDYDSEDYEDVDEILGDAKDFNPKPKNWKKTPFNISPRVTVDCARRTFWEHGKKEIRFLRQKVTQIYSPKAKNLLDKVAYVLAGPHSNLFHEYKLITKTTDYAGFVEWIGAVFFSAEMQKTWRKLCEHERVDVSDLASSDDFNDVWRKLEAHAKGNTILKRSWKVFQDALNKTLRENFLPEPKELKMQFCMDDDKEDYNWAPLRYIPVDEDSDLSRHHHQRTNTNGFNCHCVCFAASGIPVQLAFERVGWGVFDTVVDMFKKLFGDARDFPDLTNRAALNADRMYLRKNLLVWWLMTGGDCTGTLMRQDFIPFTFGKSAEHEQNTGQKNIPTDTQKVVHQATHVHNFGKKSNKNHRLTCTAYSSGISSAVNLSISSEHHERHFDMVTANPSDSKWYFDESLTPYETIMHGFTHLAGCSDPRLDHLKAKLESLDSESEDDDEFAGETAAQREKRLKQQRIAIVEELDDGEGHGDYLRDNIISATAGTLDAGWWTQRSMCQTSSNSFGQIKVLTPTVVPGHDLRGDLEIVAR